MIVRQGSGPCRQCPRDLAIGERQLPAASLSASLRIQIFAVVAQPVSSGTGSGLFLGNIVARRTLVVVVVDAVFGLLLYFIGGVKRVHRHKGTLLNRPKSIRRYQAFPGRCRRCSFAAELGPYPGWRPEHGYYPIMRSFCNKGLHCTYNTSTL